MMYGINEHAGIAEVFCKARTGGETPQVPEDRGGAAPSRDELTPSRWASKSSGRDSVIYVSALGTVSDGVYEHRVGGDGEKQIPQGDTILLIASGLWLF